ncbi:hypothetical protein QWJ34_07990 [Saccharibacillus sp. CPCC 101409]|nr:hypothetical protein [Saccharibacillus sp. CPCC 101409]MDO3409702.1 hypothetical protein [Saccharibacillus sp. CPCC 101409]
MDTQTTSSEFSLFIDILSDMVCQYLSANREALASENAKDEAA